MQCGLTGFLAAGGGAPLLEGFFRAVAGGGPSLELETPTSPGFWAGADAPNCFGLGFGETGGDTPMLMVTSSKYFAGAKPEPSGPCTSHHSPSFLMRRNSTPAAMLSSVAVLAV